jgi:hypothetical protein
MQCVPPSKQESGRPQSQGNLEFRNPMSGRHWRRTDRGSGSAVHTGCRHSSKGFGHHRGVR